MTRFFLCMLLAVWVSAGASADQIRDMQLAADEEEKATWAHWGNDPDSYKQWSSHSNRLVPVYSFGISLREFTGKQSVYRDANRLRTVYGKLPKATLNRNADYMDQTDIYRLQKQALIAGKKYIILVVFDGMDWQTTQAAAIYQTQKVDYDLGRGAGLYFQDYRGTETDYGYMVSSPHNSGTEFDLNAQTVINPGGTDHGGYSVAWGGSTPWAKPRSDDYLLGEERALPHVVTDSASSATSMTSGIKTYNSAINVDFEGKQVTPIARQLQATRNFSIGVVTSVPISHATAACAYANNVNRNDYQDLTRDMLGLPSISHRTNPLPGVDVLLGGGWGEMVEEEEEQEDDKGEEEEGENEAEDKDKEEDKEDFYDIQGNNAIYGNKFLTDADLKSIDVENGGKYRVATRTKGKLGKDVLLEAARKARKEKTRLFGFFGAHGGNLPYQTADGKFDPVKDKYTKEEISENPTLAEMTRAALGMLSANKNGFWLMVEAGDVDWANHGNNIDNSIGAVLSGDDAFRTITHWVEKYNAWDETAVIVTADHGHYLVLDEPSALLTIE